MNGVFQDIKPQDLNWNLHSPPNSDLSNLDAFFNELKSQRSGLQDIWQQIRNYKPSTAEKVAFAAFAAATLLKVSDEVVNQIKLWKRNVREQKAADAINQGQWNAGDAGDRVIQFFTPKSTQVDEYFQFNSKDERPKFLYLSAESDHGNALDPKYVSHLLASFDQDFDLKFSLVNSYENVCHEITEGAKTGKLINIIIDAHGSSDGERMELSIDPIDNSKVTWINASILQSTPSCFSGIHPSGRILLTSCCTGSPMSGCDDDPKSPKRAPGIENIAEIIAEFSQRTVVAPTKSIWGSQTEIQSNSPAMLFHPHPKVPDKNVFKTFNPQIKLSTSPECANLLWENLHPREIDAMSAIKTELVAKSILSPSVKFQETQDYLRICTEDPKPKVLYLSADHDINGALEPKKSAPFLSSLAQNYDLKFKVISSFDEICREISDASKAGTIAAVIIDAHGSPNNLLLSQTEPKKLAKLTPTMEWINDEKDFAGCFASLYPFGKIVLAGGSTGAPQMGDRNNNLAQKIATKSNLWVEAPIHSVYGNNTNLHSATPFKVFHPREDDANENAFRTYVPGATAKLELTPNCLTKNCPDLNEKNLHSKALAAIESIKNQAYFWTRWSSTFRTWQENLRLRADDRRPKFIFFSGKEDVANMRHPDQSQALLSTLSNDYDLEYTVIDSWKDVCQKVNGATKLDKISTVWIEAEESNNDIILSNRSDGTFPMDEDYSACFSNLQQDGRIILAANAGNNVKGTSNLDLAQKIADTTKKTVVAPNESISPNGISIHTKDPFMPFHASSSNSKKNVFQTFTSAASQKNNQP